MPDEHDLLDAQRDVFLDPEDPEVQAAGARATASRDDWIDAARRSPVYDLAMRYGVALPLHPEYRTLPMVWYVPPLSPVVSTLETDGYEADPDDVFGAIDTLRIPLEYLANLLDRRRRRGRPRRPAPAGGDARPTCASARSSARSTSSCPAAVGLTGAELERMYRLLAIANYEDRYVIPQAHAELGERLMQEQGGCGLDFEGGPGNCGAIADPRPRHVLAVRALRRRALPPARHPQARRSATAHETPPHATPRRRAPWALLLAPAALPRRRALAGARDELAGEVVGAARRARCARRSSASSPAGRATRRRWRAHYVETFDLRRRASLYLTYYAHGDTRERGMALLRLKKLYRAAGLPHGVRRAARPPDR